MNLKFGFWFLLFFGVLHGGNAQPEAYKFTRLDVEDGLSHNRVQCFLRDSKGFLWIGTISGLNRFDGYTFKVFRGDPADSLSLPDNSINSLFEGPQGELWITTSAGLAIYDPVMETFTRNVSHYFKTYAIPTGVISSIFRDSKNAFWFIHQTQGLFRFDPVAKETIHFEHRPGDSTSVAAGTLGSLVESKNGDFWLIHRNGILERLQPETSKVMARHTTLFDFSPQQEFDFSIMSDNDSDLWIYPKNDKQGVFYLNTKTGKLRHLTSTSAGARLNTDIVSSVVCDNTGIIWIGTDHGGVNLLDKKDFSVQYLLNDQEDEKSLSQNSVTASYKDSDGIIWIGTFKKGISYYHENVIRFGLYRHLVSHPGSISYDDVNRFVEDDKGNLWIGTNGGGLIYFDRKKNTFKTYHHEPGNSNSISNDVIVSLCIDHHNVLWIGTFYGGLNSFDGRTFTRYKRDAADAWSLSNDSVWEIFEDSRQNLWIGTLNGGLDLFDPHRKGFQHYRSGDNNSLKSNDIFALMEDRANNLWVGTTNGVDKLERKTGKFIHYGQGNTTTDPLSSKSVLCLLEDSRGLIWVGTQEGLNVLDEKHNTFRSFRKADGLPHNTILTLLEDRSGGLWMATPNGLCNLVVNDDLKITRVKNYDELDGLQGREFNENAALKTKGGELIFGGANGFNIFKPDRIGFNKRLPRVVLTDFSVFNKPLSIGEAIDNQVVLTKAITETQHVELKYRDNVFSIEFAALNFLHPQKNSYKYRLEGFDQDWVSAEGTSRKVTYTNLNPGDYTFRVIASNNDGFWNEEGVSLAITVLPPFWRTRTAMFIYILLIIGALVLAQQIVLQRERMKVRIEQEHQEAQRMHELDLMKTRFFTNVSHEFRTPLSLILTPIEKLLKTSSDHEQRSQFQMIHRNARRLLTLVNQLLDFRRMEVQEIKYNPSEGDIIRFIRETVFSFSDISEKKHIRLEFHATLTGLETLFDQDKLEKILFNLLSNAFKFTPEGGAVVVDVDLHSGEANLKSIDIQVKDTGIGIPKEKQEKIFERFFQNEVPGVIMNQGSGIGLSITREFVRIHGGTIQVESEPEKGSTFTVSLPVKEIRAEVIVNEGIAAFEEYANYESDLVPASRQAVVLLIEDNEDFRFYLKDNLKQLYTIVEAKNGTDGLEKAFASIPDLIVSDVMMPEMSGIEFCKKIKTDPRTSHIPVILLTARASEEQKLEGFETGANDYITKPFNFEILQSRIKNLIRQQDQLRRAFQKHLVEIEPGQVEVTSVDEKLIHKAMEVVEKNIANSDFSVEELSRELNMSRVNLYKKLLSLTGHAPIEFIRIIRLKRAAQLLEKSQLTVAEVAYQVGFNNPKYFARYFREMYKVLPSAYADRARS